MPSVPSFLVGTQFRVKDERSWTSTCEKKTALYNRERHRQFQFKRKEKIVVVARAHSASFEFDFRTFYFT